jgi:predicted nucleotidyltransferase
MTLLDSAFLDQLITSLDSPNTIGIALTGSHARGDATPLSDVDILCFVETLPEDETQHYVLHYRSEVLVSISMTTLADKREQIRKPQSAIFAVPGLRQMRILRDRRDELSKLKAEAEAFIWSPLQAVADAHASYQLMGFVEEVHKILNGLRKNHEVMLLNATLGLCWGMVNVVAVQSGLLVDSENVYFEAIQGNVGQDSAWSRAFRQASGLAERPDDRYSSVQYRACAALQLYRETVILLQPIIRTEHQVIIKQALSLIERL